MSYVYRVIRPILCMVLWAYLKWRMSGVWRRGLKLTETKLDRGEITYLLIGTFGTCFKSNFAQLEITLLYLTAERAVVGFFCGESKNWDFEVDIKKWCTADWWCPLWGAYCRIPGHQLTGARTPVTTPVLLLFTVFPKLFKDCTSNPKTALVGRFLRWVRKVSKNLRKVPIFRKKFRFRKSELELLQLKKNQKRVTGGVLRTPDLQPGCGVCFRFSERSLCKKDTGVNAEPTPALD